MRAILKNKTYLYLTEFFAGMSVMAVELGASRLLAPYFSSSQIVWTIIIGTIMIAMALGNIYGGRSADRDPNPDRLYRRILIAAIWIALIPAVGKYVILGISAVLIFSVNANYLVWAAFAACMVIFVFPLFLLGTVTPSLAKYSMENLDDNARIVGTLGAANTIGSIIGTFLPTFVTIPSVGTSVTFLLFSGILMVIALIEETDDSVILSTNVLFGVQSILRKDDSLTGMYYDYAMAAPLMADAENKQERGEPFDLLVLGMGTGTYGSQCRRSYPAMSVTGVEIDGKITRLARDYFRMPDDMRVITYDGRAYLNAVEETYDVIMVDAYQDITIPFQMASGEFFRLVREHLKDDGVMVVNMNMRGQREGNINQYLADTIAAEFSEIYTADVPGNSNRELFASNNPDMLSVLEENIRRCEDPALREMVSRVRAQLELYEPGEYRMTDDRAPVELLSMQVIDDLIRDEVAWYRQLYEEQGIQAVINSL